MKKRVEDLLSDDKLDGLTKPYDALDDQERLALTIKRTISKSKGESLSAQEKASLWKEIKTKVGPKYGYKRLISKRLGVVATLSGFLLLTAIGFFYFKPKRPTDIQRIALANKHYFLGASEVKLLKANKESVLLETDSAISYQRLQSATIPRKIGHEQPAIRYSSIGVPYGKRSELSLEDGTRIWLNAGSVLTFPEHFADHAREVYLEGEGYFEIAPDVHRPFTVKSAQMSINVLGTSFNLSAYADDAFASTTLFTGKVEISSTGSIPFQKQILHPGMEAKISKAQRLLAVNKASESFVSWTKRRLLLHKMSIREIKKKLERFYNTPIVDQATFSADDTFSGSLDLNQTLEEVLTNIYDEQSYTITLKERRIYIQKK